MLFIRAFMPQFLDEVQYHWILFYLADIGPVSDINFGSVQPSSQVHVCVDERVEKRKQNFEKKEEEFEGK